MPVSTKPNAAKNRVRNEVLTAAVVTTLAASGVSHAAMVFPTYPTGSQLGSSQITQYIGPKLADQDSTATGNTFQIAVTGFDVTEDTATSAFTTNDSAFLVGPVTVTFGTTKTVTNATNGGETLTITSSETVKSGVTTDKITFSVPSAFVAQGTTFTDGDVINQEDLELGFAEGPLSGLTLSQPVNTSITASGSAIYHDLSGGKHTYTFSTARGSAPYTYLDSTHTNLSADEGLLNLYSDGSAANFIPYNLSSFSFSFSYATPAVPEPATGAVAMVLGSLGLMRRRRNRVESSSVVDLSSGLMDDSSASMMSPGVLAAAPVAAQSGAPMASIESERLI